MEISDYIIFCNQLVSTTLKYPNLKIKEVDGIKFLKGIIDIPDDDDNIIGSFSIEITFSNGFPYKFPILYEVGGDIPNEADWHKYSNKACCITIEPNELLICKNGINISTFIENHVISYFANHIHKKIFGEYKNGEYLHGTLGLKQFYTELFKTTDENKWIEYIKIVFSNHHVNSSRNIKCFCGSNIKFKNCHDKVFHQIQILGKEQIIKDLKKLIK